MFSCTSLNNQRNRIYEKTELSFNENKFHENSKSTKTTTTSSSSGLKAEEIFDEIIKRAKNQPELVKKVLSVIVFDVTKDGKVQQSWSKSREIDESILYIFFHSY